MTKIDTPNQHSIDEVCDFLKIPATQTLKTLIVEGSEENSLVALLLRGDHELNEIKAEHLEQVASPLQMASDEAIQAAIGCAPGSISPVGLSIPMIADHSALALSDFVCGANENGKHLKNVNWERDLELVQAADLRNIVEGDASPDGKGTLSIVRGIEVGHIFQLGDTYSSAMDASVLNENGKASIMTMGCYGIGVSRVVAAAIEQNHDDRGIIWPDNIAPFHIAVAPIKYDKSALVKEHADKLYQQLKEAGYEVLLYDEKTNPGAMFANLDLIGIPHRVVISERGIEAGEYEYKCRRSGDSSDIAHEHLLTHIKDTIKP